MGLINVATGKLVEPAGSPEYAILSHTWGCDELTFEDMADDQVRTLSKYSKIRGAIEQARRRDIRYVWIDTLWWGTHPGPLSATDSGPCSARPAPQIVHRFWPLADPSALDTTNNHVFYDIRAF